jgi:hypothetical protein
LLLGLDRPRVWVTPIMPISAPEISIEAICTRWTLMPAVRAAR